MISTRTRRKLLYKEQGLKYCLSVGTEERFGEEGTEKRRLREENEEGRNGEEADIPVLVFLGFLLSFTWRS